MVLDLDHADEPTHGPQELAFYHHYYRSYGSLPQPFQHGHLCARSLAVETCLPF